MEHLHISSPVAPEYVYQEGSFYYEDLNPLPVVPVEGVNFQTAPVWEGFDMEAIVPELHREFALQPEQPLYLVVFRSRRREELSPQIVDALTSLDRLAEIEARERLDALGNMALLLYFKGMPDDDRNCLSWCIWTDPELAHQAVSAPHHMEAAKVAREAYEPGSVVLEKFVVTMTDEGVVFTPVVSSDAATKDTKE